MDRLPHRIAGACALLLALGTTADAHALLSGTRTVGEALTLTPSGSAKSIELRQWWEASAPLLRRIPKRGVVVLGAAQPQRQNKTDPLWYQVVHAGTWGWVRASELNAFHGSYSRLPEERRAALRLAQSAMGFSYWWSNARWRTNGPTTWPTKNLGTCSGTCGDADGCEHTPTPAGATEYGADCSGFVSTVWGFPDTDPNTNPTNNGYQTSTYASDRRDAWATVELDDALPGDAIVHYDTAARSGHIALVAKARDSRGYIKTYECEGCDAGCRARRRLVQDADVSESDPDWHAIRRDGWPAS